MPESDLASILSAAMRRNVYDRYTGWSLSGMLGTLTNTLREDTTIPAELTDSERAANDAVQVAVRDNDLGSFLNIMAENFDALNASTWWEQARYDHSRGYDPVNYADAHNRATCSHCGVRRMEEPSVRHRHDDEDVHDVLRIYTYCDPCAITLTEYHTTQAERQATAEANRRALRTEIEVIEVDDPSPDLIVDESTKRMQLPSIAGFRSGRLLSFEQELAAGGYEAVASLHRAGLTAYNEVRGYHSGGSGASDEICYVERDSSVDSEIIWSKLKLSRAPVAERFETGLQLVHDLVKSGDVSLNMRCGGHTHVDATGLNMKDLMSLYVLWNHVEDVMYRIASANWKCHRTQYGNDYCPTIPKGLSSAQRVYNDMSYGRGALNMSNYLSARSNCRCGATQTGIWSDCTCSMSKPTIEFRVWNTTANLVKVHAYMALSLSMVEYAKRHTMSANRYPEHPFTGEFEATRESTEDSLQFIMEKLPLTERERKSVQYCVDRCSLAELY